MFRRLAIASWRTPWLLPNVGAIDHIVAALCLLSLIFILVFFCFSGFSWRLYAIPVFLLSEYVKCIHMSFYFVWWLSLSLRHDL